MGARWRCGWLAFVFGALCLPAAAEEKVLHVMVFDPTGLSEAWRTTRELAREFEAEHPGVRVKMLSEGGGDFLTKLKIMLAARQPLDVSIIDVMEFSSLLEDGILLDLQPYFDADATWDPNQYFEVAVNAFRDGRGHLYGLPSTFTPYVMYYNQDIFDRAGIPYPSPDWTWDDFLSIARRCNRPPEQYGVSITQWMQALAPWIWQSGGAFLSDDGARCLIDTPETLRAFEFLHRLFQIDAVTTKDASIEGQVTRGSFQDGTVAMYGPVGYWEVFRFKNIDDFRWDVCPLPRGAEAATSIAMRSYVAFEYTEHPELAYRFIRKLAGARLSHTLARIGNGVPGHKGAAHSEDFLKPDVAPESERVFLDVLEHARFLPVAANWREIENAVTSEIQGCLVYGEPRPVEACRRMTEKVEALLTRERSESDRPRAPLTGLFVGVFVVCLAGIAVAVLPRRARSPLARREHRRALGFLTPWGIGFVALLLGPMLVSLVLSFTSWSPIREISEARWVGGENLSRMLADDDFTKSLGVTTLYSIMSVPLCLVTALGLALLVRRGYLAFRAIFYMPVIASAVAVGLLWLWMLNSSVVETLLGGRWMESREWIVPGFVAMSLWGVGTPMLVFLAGLQGIDGTLYEAARLDGASRWRQFLHVTLPQLTPVILFNAIIGIIGAFQLFAQPFVMTDGGPGNESLFYVLYLFKTAFRFHEMGYASALGWVLFLLLLVLTVVLLRSSRHWVHYEGEAA